MRAYVRTLVRDMRKLCQLCHLCWATCSLLRRSPFGLVRAAVWSRHHRRSAAPSMADATIANAPAETSVTGGHDDDPVDVPCRNDVRPSGFAPIAAAPSAKRKMKRIMESQERGNAATRQRGSGAHGRLDGEGALDEYESEQETAAEAHISASNHSTAALQHLSGQAEKIAQNDQDVPRRVRRPRCTKTSATTSRRHDSDKVRIHELKDKFKVKRADKLLKMKSQAEPPRPSLSAEAQGDENFHLEVHGGNGATVSSETVLASCSTYWQRYYQRNRETILARHRVYDRTAKGQAARFRKWAKSKMKRILELQERGNGATLDQLGEVFMQRCRIAATRDALARLLAARGVSVGTSASASGSSEASSGSGGGVPSPAAAAAAEGLDAPVAGRRPRGCGWGIHRARR